MQKTLRSVIRQGRKFVYSGSENSTATRSWLRNGRGHVKDEQIMLALPVQSKIFKFLSLKSLHRCTKWTVPT